MSGSLNIYPFQDTETTIRFGVQITLFLVGLVITNHLIIKPALKLQAERKKRTVGNQSVAQSQLKVAEQMEHEYAESIRKSLEEARSMRDAQIKQAQALAVDILTQAHQKASQYMETMKSNLDLEKEKAATEIPQHVAETVHNMYLKLGIHA